MSYLSSGRENSAASSIGKLGQGLAVLKRARMLEEVKSSDASNLSGCMEACDGSMEGSVT